MTIREQIHQIADNTDEAVLEKWLEHFHLIEENASPDISQALSLWAALTEPMSEEDAAIFAEATKHRPFFREDAFAVQPD